MRSYESEKILRTEYSTEFDVMRNTRYPDLDGSRFDELRKDRVLVSQRKYGHARDNFGNGQELVKAIGSMKKCILKYNDTGNTEYLVDAGNYCMFEYMFPIQPSKVYLRNDATLIADSSLYLLDINISYYITTNNKSYLIDVLACILREFLYPTHTNAYFSPTRAEETAGIDGICINEIKAYQEEE